MKNKYPLIILGLFMVAVAFAQQPESKSEGKQICADTSQIIEITKESQFKELIKSDTLTLVDFHATWCGPCKMMAPVIEKLKKTKGDSLAVLKVDIDMNSALASKYRISAVPTLILFKSGKAVWTHTGVIGPLELQNEIEKH